MNKMLSIFFVIISIIFVNANKTYAETFQLLAKGIDDLNQNEKEKVNLFLKDVESILPIKLKNQLNKKITINFFKDESNFYELSVPNCETESFVSIKNKPKKKLKSSVYGQFSKKRGIFLNYYFLPEIIQGNSFTEDYPCEHKNFLKLAKATLIHELSHAFDSSPVKDSPADKNISRAETLLNKCIDFKNKYLIYPHKTCKLRLKEREGRLSGLIQYKHLSGYSDKGFLFPSPSLSHYQIKRSPLPYEYSKLAEHFPVNMEFFLLDPEYKCRRPALYNFFKKYFNHTPFPREEVTCQVNTHLELNNKIDQVMTHVNLDKKYVHSIHYLYATSGKKLSEKFGTGMFRVVLCDYKGQKSKNCIKDSDNDIVFSYERTKEDLIHVNIQSMMDIKYFYNDLEFRSLYSLPINFDTDSRELFISQLLSDYWELTGRYDLLKGKTITRELLRSIKGSLKNYDLYTRTPLSPKSLYRELVKSKIVKRSVFLEKNRPEENGYIFKTNKAKYELMFQYLKRKVGKSFKYKNLDGYLLSSRHDLRKKLFESIQFKSETQRLKDLNVFNMLEDLINLKSFYKAQSQFKTNNPKDRFDFILNKSDYGIPLN